MSEKETFDPLYSGGFHVKTLEEIKKELVDNFPNSETRLELYNKFVSFVDLLINKLHFKPDAIWLDGSYTTVKEDPADIDLLVVYDAEQVNSMSQSDIDEFGKLQATRAFSQIYSCDAYFTPSQDVNNLSYWRGWFGFDRKDNVKGIVKLTMEESV
ncbi:DUF6932 family protein [Marinomonas ostreistagni]|uniref:Nucleotidyltransferase n=1 Tax=Marinomonas ostreistagni TaxID=359209 RepID=A0ABS0ZAU1_9GAMM|nr:hypothetical protein [Marinomonas ostreistagni]MBJ7550774.1 hypothetical protein [Marinomonas ostreistagni]